MLEYAKPPDPDVIADARRLAEVGADREMILVFLRERGFDKIDSIKALEALYGLSISEAKELIDYSVAWSDQLERDMRLWETALRALRDLAASKDPSLPRIELPEPEELDS
jgi:hypothetical protein